MKNSIVAITIVVFMGTLFSVKYLNLRNAYHKAEKEKVEYCKKYNDLKGKMNEDSVAVNLLEKDYYELWEENQIFASMLSEIENQPGGHEMLDKLWNEKKKLGWGGIR